VDWEPRFGGRAELCLIADTPEGELLPAAPIVLGRNNPGWDVCGYGRLHGDHRGAWRSGTPQRMARRRRKIAPATAGAAKPQRAEYVERLCRQFDFGTPIASRFVIALRGWKDIFDRFPILDSPAYHAIRAYFRWERFTPRCKTPAGNPNGNSRTFAKDGLRIGQCNFTGENADYATVGHTAIITSKSMRLQRKINAIIETTSAVRLMTSIRCSPASAL
jgi:hypothetical protein